MDKGFGRWSVLTNDVENAMSGSFTSGSGIEYSPLAWMEWKDGAWSEQWPYNGCTSVVAYEDVGTVHNKFICARSYGLASNPLHFIALSISSPISFRLFACRINWLAVWHDQFIHSNMACLVQLTSASCLILKLTSSTIPHATSWEGWIPTDSAHNVTESAGKRTKLFSIF